MPNLSTIVKKLQRAILSTGLVIKLGSSQFYSEDQKRMITMWILSTPIMEQVKGKWKKKDLEILRTASQAEIVTTLKEIWETSQKWE